MDDNNNYKDRFLGYYSTNDVNDIFKIYSNEYNIDAYSVVKYLKNNNFTVKKITPTNVLSDREMKFHIRLINLIILSWKKLSLLQKVLIPIFAILVLIAIFTANFTKPNTSYNMMFSGDAPMRDEFVYNYIISRMKHEEVDSKIIDKIQEIDKETTKKIEKTLDNVVKYCKIIDVNDDGKFNSIDAAVIFYMHYPDRNEVLIISNKNEKAGFNHIFNAVKINGIWRAIEPQAYVAKYKKFLMNEVWSNEYDSSLNKVDHGYYTVYASRRFLLDSMNLPYFPKNP